MNFQYYRSQFRWICKKKPRSLWIVRVFCISLTFSLMLMFLSFKKYFDSQNDRKSYEKNKAEILGDRHTFRVRKLLNASTKAPTTTQSIGDYPEDIFTLQQKEDGWIALHVVGVLYMFLALAIVCDEFFVPSLHVISKILKISDDVAGATFMAAGGSAPELFTSIIGLFFSQSQVGFGTIVGSAVFNVLFVIGMCAIFSKTLLTLTWWPLLRDSIFYIIALILLIGFFSDSQIEWYEALILFLVYIAYVIFMVFNERIEARVKGYLAGRFRSSSSIVSPTDEKRGQGFLSFPSMFAKNTFRNGAIQLVIHTLDPIAEVAVENKFQQLKDKYDSMSTNTLKDLDENDPSDSPYNSNTTVKDRNSHTSLRNSVKNAQSLDNDKESYELNTMRISVNNAKNESVEEQHQQYSHESLKEADDRNGMITNRTTVTQISESKSYCRNKNSKINSYDAANRTDSEEEEETNNKDSVPYAPKNASDTSLRSSIRFSSRASSGRSSRRTSLRSHRGLAHHKVDQQMDEKNVEAPSEGEEEEETEEEEEGPIDMSWPDGCFQRIFYVIKAPLVFLMIILIPDVRRPSMKKLYPIAFIMSIVVIGMFSYIMLWLASEIGRTAGVDVEIMGLTFIAAGTSIPDLITSVVVARQGLGDMAVSSSIGSNIFDVTVGLPLPWLAYSISKGFKAVVVSSSQLFCSTVLLFLMLIAIVITIAVNKWRMTKILGGTMFLLYIVFITLAVLLQINIIGCPFDNA